MTGTLQKVATDNRQVIDEFPLLPLITGGYQRLIMWTQTCPPIIFTVCYGKRHCSQVEHPTMGHLYHSCVKLPECMIRRSDPVVDFLGRHEVVCAQSFSNMRTSNLGKFLQSTHWGEYHVYFILYSSTMRDIISRSWELPTMCTFLMNCRRSNSTFWMASTP